MMRLAAFLAACVMAVVIVLLALWGVNALMLLIVHHTIPKWIALSSSSIYPVVIGIVFMMDKRKRKKPDDDRQTPLVRRNLVTGVREL